MIPEAVVGVTGAAGSGAAEQPWRPPCLCRADVVHLIALLQLARRLRCSRLPLPLQGSPSCSCRALLPLLLSRHVQGQMEVELAI